LGDFFILVVIFKMTEVCSPHFLLLFTRIKICNNFDKECIGLHLGRFFSQTRLVALPPVLRALSLQVQAEKVEKRKRAVSAIAAHPVDPVEF
jgi:hypothetical protein